MGGCRTPAPLTLLNGAAQVARQGAVSLLDPGQSPGIIGRTRFFERRSVLFRFLRGSKRAGGQIGVVLRPDGVALAQVERSGDGRPRLLQQAFRQGPAAEAERILARLVDELGLEDASCNITLPPGEYHLHLIEAPDVPPDELRQAVRWRIKDQVEFDVGDAVVDVFDLPGQNTPNRARMMYGVAAYRGRIEQLVNRVQEAGLKVQAVDIAELSLCNLLMYSEEDQAGLATLLMDEGHSLITITCGGELYLSRNLDTDLNRLPALDQHDALGMDLEFNAPQALNNLLLEIQRSLDYYESHYSGIPAPFLFLAPPASAHPGLADYLQANLDARVHTLDLNELLDCGDTGALDDNEQAQLLLSVGAALRSDPRKL